MLWKLSDSPALTATPPKVKVKVKVKTPPKVKLKLKLKCQTGYEGTQVVQINLADCGRAWSAQCPLWRVVRLVSLGIVVLAMRLVEMFRRTFMMFGVVVVVYVVQL